MIRYIKEMNILSKISEDDLQRVFSFTKRQSKKLRRKLLRLDQNNTWLTTYEEISEFVKRTVQKQLNDNKNIIKNVIFSNNKMCGTNGCVYFDAMYNNIPVVVKTIKNDNITETFFESLLNLILSKEENEDIAFPKIYRMGFYPTDNSNFVLAIIQEKIEGRAISNLHDLQQAMSKLCYGLYKLRYENGIGFSHRDLHAGNIMYNSTLEKIYFIDLGYSCTTLLKTCGSIQYKRPGGYKMDPKYSCNNEVHDICTLLLNLRSSRKDPWLIKTCHKICLLYKEKQKYDPDPELKFQIKPRWSDVEEDKEESFFHFWYMYKLYKVDIGRTIMDIRSLILGEVSLADKLGAKWGLKF